MMRNSKLIIALIAITILIAGSKLYRSYQHRKSEQKVADYIIDGDTFVCEDGTKVRLIGVDTPELGHDGEPDEPGARAARSYLISVIANKKVIIVPGNNPRGPYGRLLAYVYLDNLCINEALIKGCYGEPSFYEPNTSRQDYYEELYLVNCKFGAQ